ncbi:Protein CBG08836 [Caenorhabditis briggsae]|uniref:DUF7809 domain-containing protein n=2 Tax=Caenorhabditis briggsae TaxID=6238 RepID=A0AAE9EV91_CAEBR|nr:Protein CBG08836 [Caenorhabditis briggsae]ULT86563.1 hypothetical protein L3Y34_006337 [Caenorhabditis briggsae]UMM32317.1 hypothetical protein L5515_006158 [Caenorhabditis briggsae]CAP28592.1 Protein CBG08836 [Caenorhabditis briggsae]
MSFLTNLKFPDTVSIYHAYLPNEYWDLVTFENDEACLKVADPRLNYYGGAEKLCKEIEKFRNFPGSLNKFQTELSTKYCTLKPAIYKTRKGKSYIYKHDLLAQMNYEVWTSSIKKNPDNMPLFPIVAIYLRTKECMMGGAIYEMVPFDVEKFDELKNQIEMRYSSFKKSSKKKKRVKSLKDVFEKFKGIMPRNKHDPEFTSLYKHFLKLHKKRPVGINAKFFENLLHVASIVFDEFDRFVAENESWFLLNKAGSQEPTVRLFGEHFGNYVFGVELLQEMRRAGLETAVIEEAIGDSGPMGTLYYPELLKLLKCQIWRIEFVITPFRKTSHKAVWIPTPDDNYCIDALDIIFELIEWTHVKGFFQGASDDQRDNIIKSFKSLEYVLKKDLVAESEVNQIKETFFEDLQKFNITPPSNKKEVRESSALSVEYLIHELSYLGLKIPFPEISLFANKVFQLMSKYLMEPVDMIHAVRICHFICIYSRIKYSTLITPEVALYLRVSDHVFAQK